jgi:hypothetical protein
MRKRLVYFSLSLAVAMAALVTQFSSPHAVAQRPLPDDPTEECRACDERCSLAFEVCTVEAGGRGPGFGQCMRARQECQRDCHARGGACDTRPGQAPSPSPTPSPSPD